VFIITRSTTKNHSYFKIHLFGKMDGKRPRGLLITTTESPSLNLKLNPCAPLGRFCQSYIPSGRWEGLLPSGVWDSCGSCKPHNLLPSFILSPPSFLFKRHPPCLFEVGVGVGRANDRRRVRWWEEADGGRRRPPAVVEAGGGGGRPDRG
jgi:hypothetical protein